MEDILSVSSADGTRITAWRSGSGPPLMLVHGTTADHTRWDHLLPALTEHFTVLAVDRRGRGRSGDSVAYALEREFEDVAAVVAAAGPQTSLLGHSYGALCAMEGALRVPALNRLVLYEPPFPVEGYVMYEPELEDRLQTLLDSGNRDALLTAFFREVVKMPEDELAIMRSQPAWQGRLAAAHTLVREMADGRYVFDPDRFRKLETPTLLLLGETSPPFLHRASHLLAETLPDASTAVLSGDTWP